MSTQYAGNVDSIVHEIRERLREGHVVLMGAGPRRRLSTALQAAQGAGHMLLVTSAPHEIVSMAYAAAGGRPGRLASLAEIYDSAESRIRLAAYEAGAYDVLSVPEQHMWHAEVCESLRSKPPAVLVLELCGVLSDITELCLKSRLLLARLRQTLGEIRAIILVEPMGTGRLNLLLGRRAPCLVRATDPVSPNVTLEFKRVRDEIDRFDQIVKLTQSVEHGVVIVSPSRGSATRLVERLAQLQIDTGLYHTGLSIAERRAMLQAQSFSRLQVLVTTEAIGLASSLSCPGRLIFTHPPVSPEIVLHFAGLSADASYHLEFMTLWSESDIGEMPRRVEARMTTKKRVEQVGRMLSRGAARGFVLVPSDVSSTANAHARHSRLTAEVAPLLALEFAGCVERRDDVPRGVTITSAKGDLLRIRSQLKLPRLRNGTPSPLDMLRHSSRLGVLPDELQTSLLSWQRAGLLVFRGHGRERMYIVRTSSIECGNRVDAILAGIRGQAVRESMRMNEWLSHGICRIMAVRKLLGIDLGQSCGHCDRCARRSGRVVEPQLSEGYIALAALAALPFQIRFGVAQRVVAAAFSDRHEKLVEGQIRAVLDRLERKKLIQTLPDEGGAMLTVTASGHRALKNWHVRLFDK